MHKQTMAVNHMMHKKCLKVAPIQKTHKTSLDGKSSWESSLITFRPPVQYCKANASKYHFPTKINIYRKFIVRDIYMCNRHIQKPVINNVLSKQIALKQFVLRMYSPNYSPIRLNLIAYFRVCILLACCLCYLQIQSRKTLYTEVSDHLPQVISLSQYTTAISDTTNFPNIVQPKFAKSTQIFTCPTSLFHHKTVFNTATLLSNCSNSTSFHVCA